MNGPRRPQSGRRRSKNRRRRHKVADLKTQKKFWGVETQLPELDRSIVINDDPAAIVRSLSRPPIAGHETIAEHYFDAVYERSIMLATALAAAGDMIEVDELD